MCYALLSSSMYDLLSRPVSSAQGCGISGMQYVVRKYEDLLSGALVTSACRTTPCTDEKYTTGVLWARTYYFLQVSSQAVHLVPGTFVVLRTR